MKHNLEEEDDDEDFPVQNNKPSNPPVAEDQESDADSDMIPDFDSDTG